MRDRGVVDQRRRPPERPFPWEIDMTVCIAAICNDNDEYKIVLCVDNKLSSDLGSTDKGRKLRTLPHKWRCLTAGTAPEITSLFRLYKSQFQDEDALTAENIDASMKAPCNRRKHDLAEEYCRTHFVTSHEDFMKFGKDRLPADLFHDAVQKIRNTDLEAQLIIAGFIESSAEIYYTDRWGKARPADDFAVIGQGELLAEAILLRREQHKWSSLEQTLYNVYEAKKYSEGVGTVGKTTDLAVLTSAGMRRTSVDIDNQLEKLFDKYGPKPIPDDLKFKGEYYFTSTPKT
jgi:20S proteasome alpha/beta subunit